MDIDCVKEYDANLHCKLIENNFKTALSVASLHLIDLQEILDITKEEAQRLQKFIIRRNVPTIQSGRILTSRLSTGCAQIDNILRGGLPAGRILEVYGYSGAGKTQFCLQLLIQAQQLKSAGGFNKSAVYITTEHQFPSKRFHELCTAKESLLERTRNKESGSLADNVFVESCKTKESLLVCIKDRLPKLMKTKEIGVVIIDSIAGAYRSEHQTTDYKERSLEFSQITLNLRQLLKLHDAVGLFVNQVTDNIETNETEPCLGLAWNNLVSQRYEITRVDPLNVTRRFTVIKSYECPECSVEFTIQHNGIQ